MTITSFSFLLFLAGTMLVFFIVPVKHRWLVLLAASLVFYVLAGSWGMAPLLVLTTAAVWWAGRKIGRLYGAAEERIAQEKPDREGKKQLRAEAKKQAKRVLVLTLVLAVGILVIVKMTRIFDGFFGGIYEALTSRVPGAALILLVPLGISYYTFSTVGYLLDVYWKRYEPEESFPRFLLYAVYFPHIVQGPISRYNLLGQELKKELRYDRTRVAYGMQLMVWGFFKKLVIADRVAIYVRTVYDGHDHPGSIFLLAMLLDAFQIYTDFSGYMDIALGASQIFGVKMEENFNHPFFSKTVAEFWRRWHMSLGSWFRDYVYTPISMSGWMKSLNKWNKNHTSEGFARFVKVAVPVMITWFLTGLWHGTGKTYVAWGLYYGTLITLSEVLQPFFAWLNRTLRIRTEARSFPVFRMRRTFCIFMGGRVLTSPGWLRYTLRVLQSILLNLQPWKWFDGSIFRYGLDLNNFLVAAVGMLLVWIVSMLQERGCVRDMLARQNLVVRWLIIYAAVFAVLIFGIYGPNYDASQFIYMQF
ncbi:MAG: MBOAT family protein [Lachnospiraceae bacterium]|nr:MBOAT family protein [Lachnospiraceae bacterium]